MLNASRSRPVVTLSSLEAAMTAARGCFACMFSSSDEYETAVIAERRAMGRYGAPRRHWPVGLFIGCVLLMIGIVLVWG
jgi:hypothetical protein